MSTTAPAQLDPSSLDLSGISVATAAPSDNPRTGTVYDPVVFAAGAPIWFHPLPGGSHIMVCARHWSATTPGGGAGVYTDYDESLQASWFVVRGLTGGRIRVPGWGSLVPVNTASTSRTLVGAASRAPDYLYLLHSAVIAGQPGALVQHLRVAPGGCSIYAEEVVPTLTMGSDTVVFDMGLQYANPYLVLYGTDPSKALYQIRKRWPDIGTTRQQSSGYTPGWEYFTGDGFATEADLRSRSVPEEAWVTHVVPLPGITTEGPLGFADFRQTALMSTVTSLPTGYIGQVFESRQGRPFRPRGEPIALGSDDNGSYLGHGLALQPQLEPNPAAAAMAGVSAAIPYVVTTRAADEGGSALINTWGLHTIRL